MIGAIFASTATCTYNVANRSKTLWLFYLTARLTATILNTTLVRHEKPTTESVFLIWYHKANLVFVYARIGTDTDIFY